jgi:hypothetical protein
MSTRIVLAAVAACFAVSAIAISASAAVITVNTVDSGSLVMVSGDFDFGDELEFKARTEQLSKAVVVLRSRGGNAGAGIGIGRAIRAKRFITLVVDQCSSACAIAWLGGARRLMTTNAQIGFHEVYYGPTHQASGSGNVELGVYLSELGLLERARRWVSEKGPDDINLLTKQVADAIGIDVEIYQGALPTVVNAPPAQQPAQPSPQPSYAPDELYTAALALGAANGAITLAASINKTDRASARIEAINGCRNNAYGSVDARNACKIVLEFHAMCVSVAWNGNGGWAASTKANQRMADEFALNRCRSYGGQCTFGYWACDNVIAMADRQSPYHAETFTPPQSTYSAPPAPQPPPQPAYNSEDDAPAYNAPARYYPPYAPPIFAPRPCPPLCGTFPVRPRVYGPMIVPRYARPANPYRR